MDTLPIKQVYPFPSYFGSLTVCSKSNLVSVSNNLTSVIINIMKSGQPSGNTVSTPVKRRGRGLGPEIIPTSHLTGPQDRPGSTTYVPSVSPGHGKYNPEAGAPEDITEKDPFGFNFEDGECNPKTSHEAESSKKVASENSVEPTSWEWHLGPAAHRIDLSCLQKDLEQDGATNPGDLLGLSVEEALESFPIALQKLSRYDIRQVLDGIANCRYKSRKMEPTSSGNHTPAPITTNQPSLSNTQLETFATCIGLLRKARSGATPDPDLLAQALRELHKLPQNALKLRWTFLVGSCPPELPAQRAVWLSQLPLGRRTAVISMIEEDSIWCEMAQWQTSADGYASAVQLWGRAAKLAEKEAWPPCQDVLNVFAFMFRNGDSLSGYISHIRSVLTLLRAPLGALSEAKGLLEGIRKLTPISCRRLKQRANAEQTKRLAMTTESDLHRKDVADSWVVARHFCLRYGAELVPMEGAGEHSKVEIIPATLTTAKQVSLTLYRRKMQRQPVVICRNCICRMQGKRLCGVCVLERRWATGKLFPDITYSSALALVKVAAAISGLGDPLTWGTHAFRRGWADEALKAGGPAALFYSGGWKGVAAFSYVQAQTRGAMQAAEWLVEFSDSDVSD